MRLANSTHATADVDAINAAVIPQNPIPLP